MNDLIERDKVIEYCLKLIDVERKQGSDVMNYGQERINQTDTIIAFVENLPSADRPKHYCAECKFEPIDKRGMPCSSCTNNPKNRDAFVSCEVEKKGADDGADNI